MAFHKRQGKPKSFTDRRDPAVLLLAFGDLKTARGPVLERLAAAGADPAILDAWQRIVAEEIAPEDDDALDD